MGRVSYSSSVHSSGCDASGQSHLGPSTRVASPRLVDPPVKTPRCSEAFMRWRSAPFSTLYPPTTSKSSLDSSSERSLDLSLPYVGPSRKRCRCPTTLVPSSTPVSRSIAPALADLPSCKSSYKEEFEAEASTGGTMEIAVDLLVTSGIFEPTRGDAPNLEGTLYDISHYMSGVPLDRIIEFETTQRRWRLVSWWLAEREDRVDNLRLRIALSQEEFCQIRRDRDDTRRRIKRIMTNTRSGMTPSAIEGMINRRLTKALETREANRNIGLRNGNDEGGNENGNGNGNGGGNRNGN
ncbi:hypothetical protein Tco_0571148, partial [Tanacetum coccineum]